MSPYQPIDNPLKPDGTITKVGYELVFLEIKPPRMEKDAALFLEDYWKLVNFYKDAIDFHMESDLGVGRMAAIQVFGMLLAFMFVGLRSRQIAFSS